VSTTTRSARPSNLANGFHHVPLDLFGIEVVLLCDRVTAPHQVVEAPPPLVILDWSGSLSLEPRIQGFADQGGNGNSARLAEKSERRQLAIIEIDVRSTHRSYIIHRPRTVSGFSILPEKPVKSAPGTDERARVPDTLEQRL
jgi:hypothetical protein